MSPPSGLTQLELTGIPDDTVYKGNHTWTTRTSRRSCNSRSPATLEVQTLTLLSRFDSMSGSSTVACLPTTSVPLGTLVDSHPWDTPRVLRVIVVVVLYCLCSFRCVLCLPRRSPPLPLSLPYRSTSDSLLPAPFTTSLQSIPFLTFERWPKLTSVTTGVTLSNVVGVPPLSVRRDPCSPSLFSGSFSRSDTVQNRHRGVSWKNWRGLETKSWIFIHIVMTRIS